MHNPEHAPSTKNYTELFSSLSPDEKKVMVVFPLIKKNGEPLGFIENIIRGDVVNLTQVLDSLVIKGYIVFENGAYRAPNTDFIEYIKKDIAEW